MVKKSNEQLVIESMISRYAGTNKTDLFDLVDHDLRHLGFPEENYKIALKFLREEIESK